MLRTLATLGVALVGVPAFADQTAEARLRESAKATRALAARARPADALSLRRVRPRAAVTEDGEPTRFPDRADVAAYAAARPWSRHYERGFARPGWPTADDAAALRALLAHADPALRALAAEALATLHQPEDIPRIARLLADDADALPALGYNTPGTSMALPLHRRARTDRVLLRSWHARPVSRYASQALRLMTGHALTRDRYEIWVTRYGTQPRHRLWYWQLRIARALLSAKLVDEPDHRKRLDRIARRRAAAISGIAAELARLPVEVEGMVHLMAVAPHAGGPDIAIDPARRLWPTGEGAPTHRLTRARQLALLRGEHLWPDVDWNDATHFSRLVERIALGASRHLTADDIPALRVLLTRPPHPIWWSARAAVHLAIHDLDRDHAALRAAIAASKETFVRGVLARRLIRADPASWDFLVGQLFAEARTSHVPDLRVSVLRELAATPHTPTTRRQLRALLLDPRFAPLWTRPRGAMGGGTHRQAAIAAVNAHAGKTLLTDTDRQTLAGDPTRAAKHLPDVLARVRAALAAR